MALTVSFPDWIYHPDGRSFICPSQEFFETLKDMAEWLDRPYRKSEHKPKVTDAECEECDNLRKTIASLEGIQLTLEEELSIKSDDLATLEEKLALTEASISALQEELVVKNGLIDKLGKRKNG